MSRRLAHPIDNDDSDDDDGVFPENFVPPMTPTGATILDYDIVGYFRNFFYNIATFVMVPLKFVRLLIELIFWLISIIYPFLFYLLIVWFFWYLLVIYWPYVMQVILVVGIPIANVLIILFNLFFMVAVIILMIVITIWNAFVPFLGMILYVVINVISTILADIYNAIGSIDWEPIVAGFMQILNIIVEIAVQILVVLIKVGSEILLALAKIIGPLLKILLTFVKILLPIVAWILKLLYYILSPILQILSAFFGGGSPAGSRMKPEDSTQTTGRRLFSMGLAPIVLNKTTYMPFFNEQKEVVKMPASIPEGLTPDEKDEFERFLKSIGELEMAPTDNDFFADTIREGLATPEFKGINRMDQEFDTNRKLFSWKPSAKNTLKFIDNVEEDEKNDIDEEVHLDSVAHSVARHMYVGARDMSSTDMTLAMDTMNAIMHEHRRQGDLSIQSILNDFSKRSRHMEPVIEDTLASVHYDEVVEHPEKMYQRFHNEVKYNRQPAFDLSGRKLLENWHDVSKDKMSGLRIEHARAVLEQQRKYKAYQENHLRVVTVVYSAVTKSLKKTFEEGITPSNVMKNWDSLLRSFGYKSMQEVRAHFEDTHGDAVGFIESFSRVSELPILRYFKRADQTRTESPYFHDWAIEQRKFKQEKEQTHGRRLMQMQYNQDRDVRGNGESKGSLSGFATLSSRDCFSNPKNSLCIPNIPPNFSIRIPTIKLTKKQIKGILQDISRCQPWRLTYCLVCWDRVYNAWQSFRWLLSTMPFINYPIATLTMRAPWTGVFLDWIFLVPKYHTTSFRQAICFAFHSYDVFTTFIMVWLALKILPPLYEIFASTYRNLRSSASYNRRRPYFDLRRQKAIERWMLYYQNADEEDDGSLIGARMRTPDEELRDEATSVARQLGANNAERRFLRGRQRQILDHWNSIMHIGDDPNDVDHAHIHHIEQEIDSHYITDQSRAASSVQA